MKPREITMCLARTSTTTQVTVPKGCARGHWQILHLEAQGGYGGCVSFKGVPKEGLHGLAWGGPQQPEPPATTRHSLWGRVGPCHLAALLSWYSLRSPWAMPGTGFGRCGHLPRPCLLPPSYTKEKASAGRHWSQPAEAPGLRGRGSPGRRPWGSWCGVRMSQKMGKG